MIVIALVLLGYFWHKGWLFDKSDDSAPPEKQPSDRTINTD
jgi:hypothetical protein